MTGTEPTNQAEVFASKRISLFAEGDPTPGTGAEDNPDEPATFDEKQQAKVNDLIKQAQARAAKELRLEVAVLKKKLAEAPAPKDPAHPELEGVEDPNDPAYAKLVEYRRVADNQRRDAENAKKETEAAKKEAEKAKKASIDIEKRFLLTEAAAKQEFVDTADVIQLTRDAIQWNEDDHKFYVMGDDGQPRMNSAFQPMSLDEFYAEFATKKAHLVKAGARAGNGGSPSSKSPFGGARYELEKVFGPKSDAGLANKIAKENYPEYKRLRVQAVERGLLAR